MKFIEATIKCRTGEDNIPEDLQGVIAVETEWRPCLINDKFIIYPDHTGEHTLWDSLRDDNEYITLKETFEIIKERLLS